jgi:molybdate transport system ATP-binding protein
MIDVDITKKFGTHNGFHLLRVKTSFAGNSTTQISGLSGAGKTTLLKIIAGLVNADQGKISVGGEVWLDTDAKVFLQPQQRRVGFVFQDYALFPNMSVEKHLLYGTKDRAYIKQLLAMGKLERFLHHKPRQLSGGQQQRLAILRALAPKPRLLLMDEPFSALDKNLRSGLIADLQELLVSLSMTCLVVTHQPFGPGEFAAFSFELATD